MYTQPSMSNWIGRIDSQVDPLTFRLHQKIQLANLSSLPAASKRTFGLIGFECDAGVKRNQGRIGAAKAPDEIKRALAKLPWHLSMQNEVWDVGNIQCVGDQLEEAQANLGNGVCQLFKQNVTPIILGGGHETFCGHYLGTRQFLGPSSRIGIINIDAHFDLRPYDEQTSSGTMFKQILDQDQHCGYLCVGIQKQGNTAALFETAKRYHVTYIAEEKASQPDITETLGQIDAFIKNYDYIILTLCTDVLSSAYAPGVSAPSPFGLHPKVVRTLLTHIVKEEKTLSFDIAEVNPVVDENNKTVGLAARLVNEVMMNFHE